jgi:hypothetical protein
MIIGRRWAARGNGRVRRRGARLWSGGQKKARLRQARRLLIVPFKTKIFAFNMLDNYSILLGEEAKGQVLLLVSIR